MASTLADIKKESWYQDLLVGCRILIGDINTKRFQLVEAYWKLGRNISDNIPLERKDVYGDDLIGFLALDLGVSKRTIYYCKQLYKKYPELDKIPEGKDISWNKLVTKYLPQSDGMPMDIGMSGEIDENIRHECPICGKLHFAKNGKV